MLNLLLLNDKRDPIRITDVFDTKGNLKPYGQKVLKETSKGYVSYMRGENPITFPIRLYAPHSVVPKIKYDIKGNLLAKDNRIKYILNEGNKGPSATRNTATLASEGGVYRVS